MLFSSSHLYWRRGRGRGRGRRGWTMASTRLRALPSDSWVHRQPAIDARMVVLKGSVNRHSQSRSPTSQICRSSARCRAHHASAPPPITANQDSYGGVAGQKVILRKHLLHLLAPVAGLRSTGRQVWVREEQALEAPQKGSWRVVGAPKSASRLVEPVQPRPAPFRTCGIAY